MHFNPTIRVYVGQSLRAETYYIGHACDHGDAITAHGETPRFVNYDGATETEIHPPVDASNHNRARCKVCRKRAAASV